MSTPTIYPGRYLAAIEKPKVKRARAGNAYVALEVRVLRNLTRHAWLVLEDKSRVCLLCTVKDIHHTYPDPCMRHGITPAGELAQAIITTRSGDYTDDMAALGEACGVTLEPPSVPPDPSNKLAAFAHDEALKQTLGTLKGCVAVVTAYEATRFSGPHRNGPFIATHWEKPTPIDGAGDASAPELLAILARTYRLLKDDPTRRLSERVDDVLRLYEALEVKP